MGISARIDTEGVVSEYWDMESSQTSNQLEHIGRFASDIELEYQDTSANIDSQAMMINDPLNRVMQIQKQNSSLSQILNQSDIPDDAAGLASDDGSADPLDH